MRYENNYKRMTLNARAYLMNELKRIYGNEKVHVKKDSIKYGFYDDSDLAYVFEVMTFEMSDNIKYEFFYSKNEKYLKAL